jgi:RHS repeat-associated protein
VVDATVVVSYSAVVVTATDYSPFGVGLYGRSWSGEYRYGFQGQEEDGELWSGSVIYKYRVEDARLGRFFSVDPLFLSFPWNGPYSYSSNRVIDKIELEGAETAVPSYYIEGKGYTTAIDTYSEHNVDASIFERKMEILSRPKLVPAPIHPPQATIDIPYAEKVRREQSIEFAENTGLADLMRIVFGEDHTGKVSTEERWQSAAFLFIPAGVDMVGKKILKGFVKLAKGLPDDYYKKAVHLSPGDRVALHWTTAKELAEGNGWKKNSKMSELNKRHVYEDSSGNYYAVDTEKGHFELVNSKGKHQGAMNFSGELVEDADISGGHDLITP